MDYKILNTTETLGHLVWLWGDTELGKQLLERVTAAEDESDIAKAITDIFGGRGEYAEPIDHAQAILMGLCVPYDAEFFFVVKAHREEKEDEK